MGLFLRSRQPEEKRSYSLQQMARYITSYQAHTTGRSVSVDTAMRVSAAWACVRTLTASAASLPVDVVRESGTTRTPIALPSLIREPSAVVDRDVWVSQVVWSMFTDGNAWGRITATDGLQFPTSIETLDPASVKERKLDGAVVSAKVNGDTMAAYPHGDLWYCPGIMVPAGSAFGLSPLDYASGAIDATAAAESFGARFFTDGAHPSALLKSDQDLTSDQAREIKDAFVAAISGTRDPMVMGSGLEYERLQIDPDDSQFIDLMRFEVENICRFFGVPPSMVYGAVSGQSVTYANVSQADLAYLKHSLDRTLVRIEKALTRLLPRPQTVKFNRDALLRADTLTRYQAHEIALRNKTRTVNEVRSIEDEPPFDDPSCDEPGVPGGPSTPPPAQGGS